MLEELERTNGINGWKCGYMTDEWGFDERLTTTTDPQELIYQFMQIGAQKEIIKRRTYNTWTSTPLAVSMVDTELVTDDGWYEEVLYVKRNGEPFIFGKGNWGSKYSEEDGIGGVSGRSEVIPMTNEGALQWCKDHMTPEQYENFISKSLEDHRAAWEKSVADHNREADRLNALRARK